MKNHRVGFASTYQIETQRNGSCKFFNLKNKKCKIYNIRPHVCRTFPLTATGMTKLSLLTNSPSVSLECKFMNKNMPYEMKLYKSTGKKFMISLDNITKSFQSQLKQWDYKENKEATLVSLLLIELSPLFNWNPKIHDVKNYKILNLAYLIPWCKKNLKNRELELFSEKYQEFRRNLSIAKKFSSLF